jgi:hypothetical protein
MGLMACPPSPQPASSVPPEVRMAKHKHREATKPKKSDGKLNAIGRPYSPSFNPNYRMQYQRDVIEELCKPMPVGTVYVKPRTK